MPKPKEQAKSTRLLSKMEMLDRIGVTYPTIWNWMREGAFPAGRELGGKTCWLEAEIDAWCAARPRRIYGKRDQRAEA